RLRVIDEQHVSLAADLLHAVCKARKTGETFLNRGQIDAERNAGRNRAGGVLRVVRYPPRGNSGQIRHSFDLAAGSADNAAPLPERSVAQWRLYRNTNDSLARALNSITRRASVRVVNIDDRRAGLLNIRSEAFLDRGIAFHRAVAIEMIFRDVQQDSDSRFQRRCKIDLIG